MNNKLRRRALLATAIDPGGGGNLIEFPIQLEEGHNGEIGISLYNYLKLKYGTQQYGVIVELGEDEIVYINNEKVTRVQDNFMGGFFGLHVSGLGIYPLREDGHLFSVEPEL